MAPVYGLAENAVGLAFPPPGRAPLIDRIDRDALTLRRPRAEPAPADDPHALEIVSCGQPLPRPRDSHRRRGGPRARRAPRGAARVPRALGHLRLFPQRGQDARAHSRRLARQRRPRLYGRRRRLHHRPHQGHHHPRRPASLSAGDRGGVGEIDGIRKGCVAVFGASIRRSGTERIVVVAETYATDAGRSRRARGQGAGGDERASAARRPTRSSSFRRARRRRPRAARFAAAPPRTLYRAGPARRAAAGRSGCSSSRLALAGLRPALARLAARAGDWAYAAWWWLVVALRLCGGLARRDDDARARAALGRRAAHRRRDARGASAFRSRSEGLERLPPGGAVLVFNHSSYMDVTLLAACLPGAPAFVAKRELAGQLFAGPFLRRLGALFVERFDTAAERRRCGGARGGAREGRNLVFFPGGDLHAPAGALRLLSRRVQDRRRGRPAGLSGHSARHALACCAASNGFRAGRALSLAHRAADPAGGRGFRRRAAAARRMSAPPFSRVRGAGSGRAGEAEASERSVASLEREPPLRSQGRACRSASSSNDSGSRSAYSSSPKRLPTSVASASIASCACGPAAVTVMVEPMAAPSVRYAHDRAAADRVAASGDGDLGLVSARSTGRIWRSRGRAAPCG